jgi:alpha-tubulin suppressor-like RCC1 family protein
MDMKLFKNKKLKKVVCGNNHTIVLADDSVYLWGNSEAGQTGINPKSKKKKDELTPALFVKQNVVDIFSGSNHSFLIQEKQGRRVIKGWGLNKNGQLGVGNKENFWYPYEIEYFLENNIRIKSASGGDYHSIFLTEDSQIYACGRNVEGQCGVILGIENQPVIKQLQEATNQTEAKSEVVVINQDNRMNFENSNLHNKLDCEITNSKESDSDYNIPVKIEFFNKSNIKINNIYSCSGYNYALDSNDNQSYSWGDSYSYILGNEKSLDYVRTPFAIPKEFFFNLKVDHVF